MSVSAAHEIENRRLSDEFTRHVSVEDIRLSKATLELKNAAPTLPLSSSSQLVSTQYERSDESPEIVVYHLTYKFAASGAQGEPFWEIIATLSISFLIRAETNVGSGVLKVFGTYGVLDIAHPYARELVQNLTARMRVPAFILEVLPPIRD